MTQSTPPATAAGQKSLQGIRGWLILPAINLTLGVILGIHALVVAVRHFSEIAAMEHGSLFIVEIALDTGLFLLLVYATVLFFQKKRRAPTVIITYFALNFLEANVVVVAEIFLGLSDFVLDNLDSVIHSLFAAAVWIPYFVISKRVKATFVK